jgi:hypothetical protein
VRERERERRGCSDIQLVTSYMLKTKKIKIRQDSSTGRYSCGEAAACDCSKKTAQEEERIISSSDVFH